MKANRYLAVLEQVAASGFGADIASRQEFDAARAAGHSRFVATSPGLDIDTIGHIEGLGGTVFFDGIEQARAAQLAGRDLSSHGVRVSVPGSYDRFGLIVSEIDMLRDALRWTPRRFHFHYGEIETLRDLDSLLRHVGAILDRFEGDVIDLGGGYGVLSNDPSAFTAGFRVLTEFAAARRVRLSFEFGKVVVARCAALLTRVVSSKVRDKSQVLFVDASAYNLGTLERRSLLRRWPHESSLLSTTVAGPTCYEGDIFLEDVPAPQVDAGETIALGLCGAYATSVAASLHGLRTPSEVFFNP